MSRPTKTLLYASAAECEQAFYEALDAADVDSLADLWLDDDDVCCVHPGGPRLLGYAAVKASWAALLANGPLRISATMGKTLETPAITLHNVVEEIIVTQGREQQVAHVIATNAYVKTPAGWKMVLHHASPAPGGQAADVSVEPHGTLH